MTEHDSFDPAPGQPVMLAPGLRRILAPNPSPMTFRGTNTYLLGSSDIAVIDPGPDDPRHLAAIRAALEPGQRISHIFVTHAHLDHSPLARRLAAHTGAPVLAYGDAQAGRSAAMQTLAATGLVGGGEGVDEAFFPDVALADGAQIEGQGWVLRAIWTPGHFGNHMSFAWQNSVFTGDVVMGWASSLISPPDGDLSDFRASCARLRGLNAACLHPGHGAPVGNPATQIDWLIEHRAARETAICTMLRQGPATAADLTARLYTDTPKVLHPAAARNVLAHLIDLVTSGIARTDGPLQEDARFALN